MHIPFQSFGSMLFLYKNRKVFRAQNDDVWINHAKKSITH